MGVELIFTSDWAAKIVSKMRSRAVSRAIGEKVSIDINDLRLAPSGDDTLSFSLNCEGTMTRAAVERVTRNFTKED